MNLVGKLWGRTVKLEANPFMSFHRAEVNAGFRCSKHLHANKWNGFFVESGLLKVRVYQPNGIEDVTVLGPGDYTAVAPGVKHRFESVENTVLFEVYWPAVVSEDIVRDDEGGQLAAVTIGA